MKWPNHSRISSKSSHIFFRSRAVHAILHVRFETAARGHERWPRSINHSRRVITDRKEKKTKPTEFGTKRHKNTPGNARPTRTSISPHKTEVRWTSRPCCTSECDYTSTLFTDGEPQGLYYIYVYVYIYICIRIYTYICTCVHFQYVSIDEFWATYHSWHIQVAALMLLPRSHRVALRHFSPCPEQKKQRQGDSKMEGFMGLHEAFWPLPTTFWLLLSSIKSWNLRQPKWVRRWDFYQQRFGPMNQKLVLYRFQSASKKRWKCHTLAVGKQM